MFSHIILLFVAKDDILTSLNLLEFRETDKIKCKFKLYTVLYVYCNSSSRSRQQRETRSWRRQKGGKGRGLKNCRYFFELLQICKSYTGSGRYGYSLVAKQTSGLEVPGSNPASKIKKIKNMCHLLLFAGSEVILDVESLPNLLRSHALRNYHNFSEKVQGSGSGRDKHLFTGSRAASSS